MKRFLAILLFAALVLNTAPVLASIPDPLREIKSVVFGAEPVTQDSRFIYEWNRLNQLISVTSTNANPNFKLTFEYYPEGQRAKKVYSQWNGSSWVGASTNCFYWDKWNMVAETAKKGTNTTVRAYIYGPDLAGQKTGELSQEVGGIGGLAIITEKVNNGTLKVYFPVMNNIGSVMALVDGATKTVVANYEYAPFGQPLLAKGSAKDSCPFRFSGKYFDVEPGLYYYGYRYFDPMTAKWLSNDPLGEDADINLTRYCSNQPVSNIDPLGLSAEIAVGLNGMYENASPEARKAILYPSKEDIQARLAMAAAPVVVGVAVFTLPEDALLAGSVAVYENGIVPASRYLWRPAVNWVGRTTAGKVVLTFLGIELGTQQGRQGMSQAIATTEEKVAAWRAKKAVASGGSIPNPFAKETEKIFRTMSEKHFKSFLKNGRVIGTGETSTSPTLGFAQKFDGVTVEFELEKGTLEKLRQIGVSDGLAFTRLQFPSLPEKVNPWNQFYARFKTETLKPENIPQVNIQLGDGKALELFNKSIKYWEKKSVQ